MKSTNVLLHFIVTSSYGGFVVNKCSLRDPIKQKQAKQDWLDAHAHVSCNRTISIFQHTFMKKLLKKTTEYLNSLYNHIHKIDSDIVCRFQFFHHWSLKVM